MHYKVILSILICYAIIMNIPSPGIVSAQDKDTYTIAVLDLQANGIPEAESKSLSGSIRGQLAQLVSSDEFFKKSKVRYTVVERSQMDKIFEQFQIQDTGCTDVDCAVEFGKMLGVQQIVIGSVGLVGETYIINASIVDVETSKSLHVAEFRYRGERDNLLNKGVPDIVNQLLYGKKIAKSNKKLYILAGAAIVGGAAAAYLSSSGSGGDGGSSTATGSILIVLPDPSE